MEWYGRARRTSGQGVAPSLPRRFPPPLLITSREATRSTHSRHRIPLCAWGKGDVDMKTAAQPRTYGTHKSLTNERSHPYFVDIPVATVGLDVALSRQIMNFHKSRQLQLRHGRTNSRGGEHYYRWCFADLMTALAFVEQFGGAFSDPQIADAR